MNCRQLENMVCELARGDLLEAGAAEQAARHVSACPRCAQRLEAERRLTTGLKAVAAATAADEAPVRLEGSLRAAYRQQALARGVRARFASRGPLRWAGPAVAAMIPLVIGLGVLFVDRVPRGSVPAGVQTAPRQKTAPLRFIPRDELATEFLPVLYGQEIAPDEPTHLVRVELPRSALAYFGFPFQEVSGGGSVQADILLAEDGTPRAIRFVR